MNSSKNELIINEYFFHLIRRKKIVTLKGKKLQCKLGANIIGITFYLSGNFTETFIKEIVFSRLIKHYCTIIWLKFDQNWFSGLRENGSASL